MVRFARRFILFTFLVCFNFVNGQDIPGYNMSNYAGVSGIDLQPACIADMRYKFDMTIVGAGIDFNNNYRINIKLLGPFIKLYHSILSRIHPTFLYSV